MPRLEHEGTFEAKVISIGAKPFDTGSAKVELELEVLRKYEGGEWVDWAASGWTGYTFYADVWIKGKDGNLIEDNVKRLEKCLAWNGDFGTLFGTTFAGTVIQSSVKSESYEGKTYYKGSWIDPVGTGVGGGGTKVDEDFAKSLAAQYNSLAKAWAKEVGVVATAPKPASAPPKQEQPAFAPAPGTPGDNVPF